MLSEFACKLLILLGLCFFAFFGAAAALMIDPQCLECSRNID